MTELRLAHAPLLAAGVCACAAMAGLPAAASAAVPQPPNCPLLKPAKPLAGRPIVTLPGGVRARVNLPGDGVMSRNRLFFALSVSRVGGGSLAKEIEKVSWALDGTVKRVDDRAPFAWSRLSGSRQMPAGDHTLTVTITPARGGTPIVVERPLGATDCQPPYASVLIGFGSDSMLSASSVFESDTGPTMRSVAFLSRTVTIRTPARLRGRIFGELRYGPNSGMWSRRLTLRLPRRGGVLGRRGTLRVTLVPGRRAFLRVGGLPAGTRGVAVKLGPVGDAVLGPQRTRRGTCVNQTSARLSGPQGSVTVDGGSSRGTCLKARA